ncbi:helix-turn-helix domain-containing protein [Paenibacillus sp. CGMCC 1.16610]|uniref:Excisionase family DNA-binding protein n=1 Tax=Paenibacillus anseongense TaxID=2682845 RepID=A0ABW9U1Q1_9BACL|nr:MULTISPECIES: helix-turn-helix domain-containing protein [Paenibacillus]MBA2937045.1 helix-turn-helix domain-containing protein [Paenibacillus sp. CGMCC 1.16610]MVQ33368.1 excisionase family DNA-binding protein [Paenibacillus anseongense]
MIGYVILGEEEAKKWYNGYMNSREAAEYLGISKYMLRKMVKEDTIPYTQIDRNVSFHQTILNAWMRDEFIPGRVELILDKENIDFDHRDALKEHYERYPDSLKLQATKEEPLHSNVSTDYKFEVRHDGVIIKMASLNGNLTFDAFLSNATYDHLILSVQNYRADKY